MSIKINDATPNRPEGHRLIQAPAIQVDVSDYVSQLKAEKAWQTNDRNAITVFKAPGVTIVITALHDGAEINELQVDGMLILQVMEGSLAVLHEGSLGTLRSQHILVLNEAPVSSLKAAGDCVLQLTYIKSSAIEESVS